MQFNSLGEWRIVLEPTEAVEARDVLVVVVLGRVAIGLTIF
jgi:hypothetical protein